MWQIQPSLVSSLHNLIAARPKPSTFSWTESERTNVQRCWLTQCIWNNWCNYTAAELNRHKKKGGPNLFTFISLSRTCPPPSGGLMESESSTETLLLLNCANIVYRSASDGIACGWSVPTAWTAHSTRHNLKKFARTWVWITQALSCPS